MTREELMDHYASSMESERRALGYSQEKMAQVLGISYSAYKRILYGESSKIDIYIAYQMYRLTHKLTYELGWISDPYLDVFTKLRQLSESQLNFLNTIIDLELGFKNSLEKNQSADDFISVLVPTGNMQDGMYWDSANIEKFNVSAYRMIYGKQIDCGMRVTSNHLVPVYQLNDILLISRQPIRDGDTGVFIDTATELTYIRKYRQSSIGRLDPINNYGNTIFIDDSNDDDNRRWIKFGRILTKVRI